MKRICLFFLVIFGILGFAACSSINTQITSSEPAKVSVPVSMNPVASAKPSAIPPTVNNTSTPDTSSKNPQTSPAATLDGNQKIYYGTWEIKKVFVTGARRRKVYWHYNQLFRKSGK